MQRANFIIQDSNWTDAHRYCILQARGAGEDEEDGSFSLSLITHTLRNRLIFPAGFALLIGQKNKRTRIVLDLVRLFSTRYSAAFNSCFV